MLLDLVQALRVIEKLSLGGHQPTVEIRIKEHGQFRHSWPYVGFRDEYLHRVVDVKLLYGPDIGRRVR